MSTPAPDDDIGRLGVRLAQATAPAFAWACHAMPHDERVEFVRTFLACLSGITQQAIGHEATGEAFAMVAALPPVDDGRPTPLQ